MEQFTQGMVGKREGIILLGRPKRRWGGEGNSKMDLREVGWVGSDWIDLVQDRKMWRLLVNAVINLHFP